MTITPTSDRDYDIGPIVAGNTRSIRLSLKVVNDDTGLEEVYPALDVTVLFTVKLRIDDVDPGLIRKTMPGGGIEIVDEDEGILRVKLDPADTATLLGTYWWDAKMTVNTTGEKVTIAKGRLYVEGGVTDA